MMKEKLMREVEEQCEKTMEGWTVTSRIFTKNNQVELHGIIIKRNGVSISRIVYLERLEEVLGDSFTAEEACTYIQENLLDQPEFTIPTNLYTEWDHVKGSIRKKLVNYAQNEERLKGILHRPYLDLAEVCYWVVDTLDGKGTVEIPAAMPEGMWGVTEEEVFEMADKNMALEGYQMETMESLLFGYEASCLEGIEPMYIVHNSMWEFSAAVLTRPDMIKELLKGKEGNYYIFPSSTHEIILKKDDGLEPIEKFRDLVKEVNDTCVERSIFLSDNVYYYDEKTQRVKLCENE